jgi:hypothetical protein
MIVHMCRAVMCKKCGKTTWAGCGMHVDQVLAGVPRADRCEGHAAEPRQGGFVQKLLGRG